MGIDRYHYDNIFLDAPDNDEEEFEDVTDDREPEEPFDEVDRRPLNHSPIDYLYDPIGNGDRAGIWE